MFSQSVKSRYTAVANRVKNNIHRHAPLSVSDELTLMANIASGSGGRDSYGVGGALQEFEEALCTLFEKPAGVFLPTGTLAQCAAMKVYAQQSGRSLVALHPTSHLLIHEHMAVEALWGLETLPVGSRDTVLRVDCLDSVAASDIAGLIVELPMREIGGELPTWADLVAIRQWCNEHQVAMHMDGARIWQVTEYYQRTLAELAALFDSVYVSFYKDLGGIFGAALLGKETFIDDVRVWARRAGGNPITLHTEVLAAKNGLETYLKRMPDFVAYTRNLASALSDAGLVVVPAFPQACMFHLHIAEGADALAEKILRYAEQNGVLVLPLPREGNTHFAVCEINIGEMALSQPVSFWLQHLLACIGR